MMPIFNIALQQLKEMIRDRSAVIWMVLVPCMYIFVFGSAFNYSNTPSAAKATLGILNHDQGFLATQLEHVLKSDNLEITILESDTGYLPPRYLVIPEDFTAKLLKKEKTAVSFINKPDANLEAGATAEIAVRKGIFRLLINISELALQRQAISSQGLETIANRASLVTVNSTLAGRHKSIPTGFHQQVPANTVMITMLISFLYGSATLVEEKRKGILKRIKIGPVAEYQLFLGKLLGVTTVAMFQSIFLLLVGWLVFGIYFGSDVLALLLLILAFSVSVAAMGLLLGFWIQEEEKVIAISIITALVMAAMSGCWWPIEIAPQWMQQLALFLPSGITLKALHELISFGNGLETIWPNILKMTGYSVIFTALAGWSLTKVRD